MVSDLAGYWYAVLQNWYSLPAEMNQPTGTGLPVYPFCRTIILVEVPTISLIRKILLTRFLLTFP